MSHLKSIAFAASRPVNKERLWGYVFTATQSWHRFFQDYENASQHQFTSKPNDSPHIANEL